MAPCSHWGALRSVSPLSVFAALVAGIYDGHDAVVMPDTGRFEFPSLVSLVLVHRHLPGRKLSCGGVLYRRCAVLTAAHCLGGGALGDPADWEIKAYLQPRSNPWLVAGPEEVLAADLEKFTQDQHDGFGVHVPVDVGRALLHKGFEEVGIGSDVMINDLALIPLAAHANTSAHSALGRCDAALTPRAPRAAVAHSILGLGDVGPASPAGSQVCLQGKATHLPCRLQQKTVSVLQYPECVEKCVIWFDATAYTSVPLQGSLRGLSSSLCHTMLEGVKEGRLICVYHHTGTAAAGDSGGPLLSDGEVSGILSWTDVSSSTRAVAQMPALYESTAYHRDEIDAAVDCLLASSQPEACTFGALPSTRGAQKVAAELLGSILAL